MINKKEPDTSFFVSGSSNIRVEKLSKSFFGTTVLNNVDLEFSSGEIHGLVGQNGAGKSTLGKIIGGHYQLSSGTIYLNDQKITKWSSKLALDNGIAIDVGANIGNHSIFFSKFFKKVYSFEPQESVFKLLENNVNMNNLENIKIFILTE